MAKTANLDALRTQLMLAALPHIPFDGWHMQAVERAAADLDLPTANAGLAFPHGTGQLMTVFQQWVDAQMQKRLAATDMANLKIRQKIATGVETRLEIMVPHKEAVRKLVAQLAHPRHMKIKHAGIWRAADLMWQAAGDTATDFNYYTKRSLLAAVYVSTIMYWLQDESENFAESKAFLARRIEDVLKIPQIKQKTKQKLRTAVQWLPNPRYFFKAEV